ncbi:hypothetical protein V1527DRAFT_451457 [Lipomyces starkeyi]
MSPDIVHGDNHPEPATVHAYIETVLDQHYHPGHQYKYSKCIDDDLELAHAPDLVREAIHASMDSYLERLSTGRGEAEDVDSADEVFEDVGSADDVFDFDKPIKLTGDANSPRPKYYCLKSFVEFPVYHTCVPSGTGAQAPKNCQAMFIWMIFLIVRDEEVFSMTVEEYERLCCTEVKAIA